MDCHRCGRKGHFYKECKKWSNYQLNGIFLILFINHGADCSSIVSDHVPGYATHSCIFVSISSITFGTERWNLALFTLFLPWMNCIFLFVFPPTSSLLALLSSYVWPISLTCTHLSIITTYLPSFSSMIWSSSTRNSYHIFSWVFIASPDPLFLWF